ncbi:putative guanine-nucleotide-exchange-factor, partial [Fasciola hepatica]
PPLDFTQIHSKLLLELAYTASLVRQDIRPDNREHLVNQLLECARLIRVRVASGAACIQPIVQAPGSTSPVVAFSPGNRVALDKLSRFYEAYVAFVDWIDELSVVQLQIPINDVHEISPEVGSTRYPNSAVSGRGHRLFAQLKNTSLPPTGRSCFWMIAGYLLFRWSCLHGYLCSRMSKNQMNVGNRSRQLCMPRLMPPRTLVQVGLTNDGYLRPQFLCWMSAYLSLRIPHSMKCVYS